MKKIGKLNFKKMMTNTLIIGATGAAVQVLKEVVLVNEPDTMDYLIVGAGLVLPEVIKSPQVEMAANALLAIGAYRMADKFDIAGKLGINDKVSTPKVSGSRSWKPASSSFPASSVVQGAGNSKTIM
jgi:hypothetical protein